MIMIILELVVKVKNYVKNVGLMLKQLIMYLKLFYKMPLILIIFYGYFLEEEVYMHGFVIERLK